MSEAPLYPYCGRSDDFKASDLSLEATKSLFEIWGRTLRSHFQYTYPDLVTVTRGCPGCWLRVDTESLSPFYSRAKS